jgi:hypothetical protein
VVATVVLLLVMVLIWERVPPWRLTGHVGSSAQGALTLGRAVR